MIHLQYRLEYDTRICGGGLSCSARLGRLFHADDGLHWRPIAHVALWLSAMGSLFTHVCSKSLCLISSYTFSPLTACIIVFCTLVLLVGVKESSLMNMIVTATNIVIIGFIIVLGAMHFELANWDNFFLNTQNLEPPAAVMAGAREMFMCSVAVMI